MKADVETYNGGSVVGFRPVSLAAKAWFDENVASESWQWLGSVLYVEPRYADDLFAGLADEDFTVA